MKSSFAAEESGFSLDQEKAPKASFIDQSIYQSAKSKLDDGPVSVDDQLKQAENMFAMLLKSPNMQPSGIQTGEDPIGRLTDNIFAAVRKQIRESLAQS